MKVNFAEVYSAKNVEFKNKYTKLPLKRKQMA